MLIDEIDLTIRAGHGGAGKVSFYKKMFGGPDGGNGGRGADVVIRAVNDITILQKYTGKKVLEAQSGEMGGSNRKFGKDGTALTVLVPVGSIIFDKQTNESIELSYEDEEIVICKGGLGGKGNFEFKSSRNTTPMYAQPGLPGEEKKIKVTLKLIADYGLIGLPNAGKSSLLNELTAASVKTAAYPFTTLEPNLGVFEGKVLADIPGLIEGASEGKGLGIKFLQHIEKVSVLLHCISSESEDVKKDYLVVRKELGSYSPSLLEKKEIILLTKSDLVDKETIKNMEKKLNFTKNKVFTVSIHDWDSLEKLKKLLIEQ